MRRKIAILVLIFCFLTVFSIFTFTACNSENNNQTDGNNGSETSDEQNGKTTHHYGDWVIEKDATCTKDGTKYRTCTDKNCNEIETVTILALGHNIQHHTAKQSTCIEVGWNAYEDCTRCNYSTKVEIPTQSEHNFVKGLCEWCGAQEPPTFESLIFTLKNNDTYEVRAKDNSLTKVIIPSIYNDKSVTSIAASAFDGCTLLTSITIPSSITFVNNSSFKNCSSLTDIILPESLTYIGDYAFYRCTALTSIAIPSKVTHVGDYAFNYCSSLETVNWNATACTYAGGYERAVFGYCTKLFTVKINNSVTQIPAYAFYNCTALKNITIPDGVTKIGAGMLMYCSSLTSVTIPDSVTDIGGDALANCTSLANITVGNNNNNYKSIDGNLYSKDGKTLIQYAIGKKDTSFTISNSVTKINSSAFRRCASLERLIIPVSVTSISFGTFQYCTSLTIYCEAEATPSGWASGWNLCSTSTMSSCPVVWGYQD